MARFQGFSSDTIDFLRELGANNNKAWFDGHRAQYETHFLEPAKDFVAAVAAPLQKIAPGIEAQPRVNGSIFRINRDIRFSKDKTPYKDHLDLWFWEGDRKRAVSGFFFRLTADQVIVGAGAHGFDAERLKSFRKALTDKAKAAALVKTSNALERRGYQVSGTHYARPPKGFEAPNEDAARFLLFKALWSMNAGRHPRDLGKPRFVDHCVAHWRTLAPLHRWLADHVTS